TAMVNLRVGLQRACERGLIDEAMRDTMVALAKKCFYPERSWDRLLQDAAEHGIPADALDRLRTFVDADRPDVKREDACALLARRPPLPPGGAPGGGRPGGGAALPATIFWDKLTRSERRLAMTSSDGVRGADLCRFAKATDRDLAGLLREGLLLHL